MLQKGRAVPAFRRQIYHLAGIGLHIDERFTPSSETVETIFVLRATDHSSIRLQQNAIHGLALDHSIRDDDIRPIFAGRLIQGMSFEAPARQCFRHVDPREIAERRNQINARLD